MAPIFIPNFPESTSVEVFDAEPMRQVDFYNLGIYLVPRTTAEGT